MALFAGAAVWRFDEEFAPPCPVELAALPVVLLLPAPPLTREEVHAAHQRLFKMTHLQASTMPSDSTKHFKSLEQARRRAKSLYVK